MKGKKGKFTKRKETGREMGNGRGKKKIKDKRKME